MAGGIVGRRGYEEEHTPLLDQFGIGEIVVDDVTKRSELHNIKGTRRDFSSQSMLLEKVLLRSGITKVYKI